MPTIDLPLVYHVSGKAPYQRDATAARVVELVPVPVPAADEFDAPEVVILSASPEGAKEDSEALRLYDGRYWIRDQGKGEVSRRVREQSGIISDFKLVKHLADHSLFLLSHYGSALPQYVPYRDPGIEKFKQVVGDDRDTEFEKLTSDANSRLLLINDELHFHVGTPFYRLRFTDRPLMISVAFGQTKTPHTPSVGDRRLRSIDIELDRLDEVKEIAAEWESETGKKADWRVYPSILMFGDTEATGSEKTDLLKEAKAILQSGTDVMSTWSREHIMRWLDLREAIQASYDAPDDESLIDVVAEALLAYGKDVELDAYTKTVVKRWQLRPIELGAVL